MRLSFSLWLAIFAHLGGTYNLLTSPEQLTPEKAYDYVIVGGGTAGSVLAARLSEDVGNQVLLVEAGGGVEDNLNLHVPYLAGALLKSPVDWNYTSTSQPGLNNRIINIPRGHVLGGSSCINQMAFHRPSNGTWDHWAHIMKDQSLSWKAVEKYWLKMSHLVPPVDGHDTTGEVIPSAHGYGPVNASLLSYVKQFPAKIAETSKRSGPGKFRYNRDLNAGDTLGWSWMQAAIGGGERSCASTAYLIPLKSSRDNLDVLINTQGLRLLNVARDGEIPDMRAVEVGVNSTSPKFKVIASKEVIVSSGFVGTPKILTLSGIGPQPELQRLGIDTVVDSPDVGMHLKDHMLLPIIFNSKTNDTNDDLNRNQTLRQESLNQWLTMRTGPFVNSASHSVAYLRVPYSFSDSEPDPANGAGSGHVEIIGQPATGYYSTLTAALVAPLSEGNITLLSSDPFAAPKINPNYFGHEFDRTAFVQVMKHILEFAHLSPLSSIVGALYAPVANATTDADLLAYARASAVSEDHGSHTARMSPYGANWGVVDPDHKVKKVKGLRVIDASAFPTIPNVHTQVAVYILAERAAALIRGLTT
ncbi:aryl-alcohol oxidase-like protein [Thozetella sp. PMI_491]|nr:aryl-alcohol oxidase-like protein [Thozetella sp. PMI_491]